MTLSITVAVAALGSRVADEFGPLAEAAAQQHPGGNNAANQTIPELIDVPKLAQLPDGSLGNERTAC